jgi:hypothetical protein
MRGRSLNLRGGRGSCQTDEPVNFDLNWAAGFLHCREPFNRRSSQVIDWRIVEDDRKKSKEIESIRRTEERRGKKQPDPESAQLRRRLEKNAGDLLELDLEEFLKALEEDYKLNEIPTRKARDVLASESRSLATRFSN